MKARNKITLEDFTERVAKRANVSEAEADAYIHQFAQTAGEALGTGDDVHLYRFGRFRTVHVDERSGHNPGTGDPLTISEHRRVDFEPYKSLSLAVNFPFRNLRMRMLNDDEPAARSRPLPWVLLALALLALLLAALALYSWLSGPHDAVAGGPSSAATAPAQPAPEPSPAASASDPEPVRDTGTASNTATPAGTDEPGGTESSTTADTATQSGANTTTGTDTTTAPASRSTAAPAPATTNITVNAGDTLWGIAGRQWGDTYWWPVIYAANRTDLAARNPDLIETGSSLRIPELSGTAARPTEGDLERKADAYRIVAEDYQRIDHPRAAGYQRFVKEGL